MRWSQTKTFQKSQRDPHDPLYDAGTPLVLISGSPSGGRHLPGAEKPKWKVVVGLCFPRAPAFQSCCFRVCGHTMKCIINTLSMQSCLYKSSRVDRSVAIVNVHVQKYRFVPGLYATLGSRILPNRNGRNCISLVHGLHDFWPDDWLSFEPWLA